MKRKLRRRNIGIQEVANVTDLATRYSKISARLSYVKQVLHQMSRELNSVQKYSNIELGRDRNVFIHGISEPFMKDGKQRKSVVMYHVGNLSQMMEVLEQVAVKSSSPGKMAGIQ